MSSLHVSLPDHLRAFVEERVRRGDFSTPDDYIRKLIDEDQRRAADERLEGLLLEGLDSGEATEMTKEDWGRIRRMGREELARRKPSISLVGKSDA